MNDCYRGVSWPVELFNHALLFYNFRDSLLVPFIGEGTSIFSGLVVFTILGFIAHDLGMPIEEVVKSGR